MNKRLLGVLFSLALMLGMIPALGMGMKAYAAEPYNLWVGGTEVTDTTKSGEGWSYDHDSKTLTLSGANITTGYEVNEKKYGIYYTGSDGLNIVLESGSDNKVGNDGGSLYVGIASVEEGADVIVSGGGTLTASGTFKGMETPGNITVKGGTVNAYGPQAGISGNNVTIEDGTVNASGTSKQGTGIYAVKDITINGGTVNASQTSAASYYGIFAHHGSVNINGGKVTANVGNYGICALNGSVNINGGSVIASGSETAVSGTATNAITGVGWENREETTGGKDININKTGRKLTYKKVEFPAYLLWIGGVPVTGSNLSGEGWRYDPLYNTLTLSGANISKGYTLDGPLVYGIYYRGEDLLNIVVEEGTTNTISGTSLYAGIQCPLSEVDISGKGTLISTGSLHGIYAKGITIHDVNLTAVGDNNMWNSAGIASGRSMTIVSGTINAAGNNGFNAYDGVTVISGTVNTTGSGTEANTDGAGILAGGDIDIKYGKVNATGSGRTGYGLCSNRGYVIIEEGAFLTARGNTAAIYVNREYRSVRNAIVGVGWTDVKGTKDETAIDISKNGQDLSRFRMVQFPAYSGEPTDAEENGTGKNASGKKDVNTGDENALGTWIVLLAASLTGTAGVAFARKRRDY